MAEEVDQVSGLAAWRTQMNVGDPDGPVVVHPGGGEFARIQNMALGVMMASISPCRHDMNIAQTRVLPNYSTLLRPDPYYRRKQSLPLILSKTIALMS